LEEWVYLNDQLIPAAEAKISVLDLSVLRGFGVTDYLRTYGGTPFRLRDHLIRFQNSAEVIGLTIPKTLEEMTSIVEEMLAQATFPETSIKLVLTGGTSPDQYLPCGNPIFFVIASPFVPFPKSYFEEGIKVTTECYARPFPTVKGIHYLPAVVAVQKGQKVGAIDVLFHTERGHLLETGTANFFAVKDGTIITPSSSILKGITRQMVLELAEGKFRVEERVIHLNEIPTFDGCFLTSSNKEVMPISQINELTFTIPHEVRTLMNDFSIFVSAPKLHNIS